MDWLMGLCLHFLCVKIFIRDCNMLVSESRVVHLSCCDWMIHGARGVNKSFCVQPQPHGGTKLPLYDCSCCCLRQQTHFFKNSLKDDQKMRQQQCPGSTASWCGRNLTSERAEGGSRFFINATVVLKQQGWRRNSLRPTPPIPITPPFINLKSQIHPTGPVTATRCRCWRSHPCAQP